MTEPTSEWTTLAEVMGPLIQMDAITYAALDKELDRVSREHGGAQVRLREWDPVKNDWITIREVSGCLGNGGAL